MSYGDLLNDQFNDSQIDPSTWLMFAPFSDSSMTESGGNAVFTNRGRLLTINSFPTNIDITGRFEFTGNTHDQFYIVTRTDGTATNPWGGIDNGIGFAFAIQNDSNNTSNNIGIARMDWPSGGAVLTTGTFSLSLNTFYDFRITDDGTNVALYISDLSNPFLTASDSTVFGDKIAMFNREGAGGGSLISAGSVTQLDYVQIVPEPSSLLLLAATTGVMFVFRRRIKTLIR
ncbi:MAG: PEP-CTERM sorting domain-containing protein [Deltaproteobacteria bacterium]